MAKSKDRLIDKVKGDPVDRVAARVTSQSKHHFEFDVRKKLPRYAHWDTPPKMRPIPEDSLRSPSFKDMTGFQKGQLTVLGLIDNTTNKKGKPKKRKRKMAWWVVRCVCGKYEVRSTKSLHNPNNRNDKCVVCHKLATMKRHRDWLEGRPQKEHWEY